MDDQRSPAVAGIFYPDDPSVLSKVVEDFLDGVPNSPQSGILPKAVIAPHAGYPYSGPIAASVYTRLRPFRDQYRKVVLIGPSHRVPFLGVAASSASAFETPLGSVSLDRSALAHVQDLPQFQILDEAHAEEHSLEVNLPFLQVLLGEFELVPLVVGEASPEEVAEVLRTLWGGEETLVVVSTDLSHYLPYSQAEQVDTTTARAIEELRPDKIGREQACGRIPMAGLLLRAKEEGLDVERVDLRNSGDTAGSHDQVVGYGSFIFTPTGSTPL